MSSPFVTVPANVTIDQGCPAHVIRAAGRRGGRLRRRAVRVRADEGAQREGTRGDGRLQTQGLRPRYTSFRTREWPLGRLGGRSGWNLHVSQPGLRHWTVALSIRHPFLNRIVHQFYYFKAVDVPVPPSIRRKLRLNLSVVWRSFGVYIMTTSNGYRGRHLLT